MDTSALLLELFGRIPPLAREAVEGLDAEQLTRRPGPAANTMAWLVWHMGRVVDAQIADLTGAEQVWAAGDWASHVGLEPDPSNSGYGHSAAEVDAVRPEGPDALLGYLDAVQGRAVEFLEGVTPESLDRVVDRRWDPPVTLGVRLVSIADDCLQHAGQAAYIRGLLGI
jgi:hypothetical protein